MGRVIGIDLDTTKCGVAGMKFRTRRVIENAERQFDDLSSRSRRWLSNPAARHRLQARPQSDGVHTKAAPDRADTRVSNTACLLRSTDMRLPSDLGEQPWLNRTRST